MFEFEDMSSGFHDLFLNKYSDPTPIMDLYISDSMQDMLDIDIKSEVATVVGGVNEFSSLMNNELPSLEIGGDSNSNDCDTSAWLGGPKWSAVNTDIYADVGACVNPNSVMPVISSSSVNNTTNSAVASVASLLKSPKNQLDLNTNVMGSDVQMPSPRERKSHLTFSPNMIKIPMVKDSQQKPSSLARTNNGLDSVRKDLNDDLKDIKYVQKPKILSNSQLINDRGGSPSLVRTNGSNTIKLAGGIGGLTFANSMQFNKLKQTIQQKTLNQNGSFKRDRSSSPSPAQFQHTNGTSQHMNGSTNNHTMNGANSPKMFSRINANNTSNSQQTKLKQKPTGHEFPKPAYSYSCLIAMALKNSRSGSLPVSEIYSFMCEHFPYFKTAPNGWKNSVRHNLSLNKCFEKIEKPATNGGQRKGCLWAMNPSKIAKMDEEVQKWSRKDPMAIRKAMVFPEHLEALERGEMKHGSTGESDNENEGEDNEEEQSDAEEIDNEVDETFINTPPESCEDEEPDVDFDVEVGEFYDDLSINTKEDILESISQKAFLSDISSLDDTSDLILPMAKRPRLDLNYSITTTPTNGIVNGHLVSQKTGIILNGTSALSNGHLTQTTSHQLIGINQRRKAPLINRVV